MTYNIGYSSHLQKKVLYLYESHSIYIIFYRIKDITKYQHPENHTVEHTYDTRPNYSEFGSFRIIAYLSWQEMVT